MAVSLRLMLRAASVVAIAIWAGACGQPKGTKQEVSNTAPPAPAVDSRPVIAAYGDSLTAGFGLDAGQSYPDRLQALLDAAGYKYRVINLGVSGDTTTDGVERISTVLAVHPAVVILEFGANDGLRGLPVATAKANLATIIEKLQKDVPEIILAGMTLPRNYGPDYIRPFEQMYVDLAGKYKVTRIPFILEGVGGNPSLTQPDGLHPTAEGAEIVAHTVLKWLTPILRK